MKFKLKKDLAFRRIAGELFIVDAAGSKLHELNGPAALIWEGLAAGKKDEVIAEAIAEEFDTDESTARADAAAFINQLLNEGLILKL